MTDKTSVDDWSTTADDNDNINGITLAENKMLPRDVNGALREMMAQIASPHAIDLANATGLTIAGGGTGAASADAARLGLVLPTYVADLTALGALDTSNDVLAFNQDGAHAAWFKFVSGDQSAVVTADPLHLYSYPPSGDTTGASGVWVDPDALPVTGFWTDLTTGFPIKRFGNRVFVGSAVKNDGALTNDDDGKDWPNTEYGGWPANFGQLTVGNTLGGAAVLAYSRSSDIAQATTAAAFVGLAVHDSAYASPNGVWGAYLDIRRHDGAGGFTMGAEIDITNLDDAVDIDPFGPYTANAQYALSLGSAGIQSDISLAHDISTAIIIQGGLNADGEAVDSPRFRKGITFSEHAITLQSDGTADAINLADDQVIRWWSATGTRSAAVYNGQFGLILQSSSNAIIANQANIVSGNGGGTNVTIDGINGAIELTRTSSDGWLDFGAGGGVYQARIRQSSTTGLALSYNNSGTDVKQFEYSSTGIGFFGTSPIAKPTVSGSKGSNAALTSLMTALSGYGLVTDSTT